MSGPLSHIKVLDLSRVLAAPWAAQNLADLGADVIKVERPGKGDDSRAFAPPYLMGSDGKETRESAYYCAANRGKKSITVNLSSPEGQALIRELASKVDVLIENYKVGDLARYGLGYEDIKAINPGIIYCSVTGFGQTGPEKDRPGYDFMAQGMGGLMSITGEREDLPGGGPQRVGVPIIDLTTGMYASIAICAAIANRAVTGKGQWIDVALLDSCVAFLANQAMNYFATGESPKPIGNAHPNIVPYQTFRTSDGALILACGNDNLFNKFCDVADCAHLAKDPRYSTINARSMHIGDMYAMVEALAPSRTTTEWVGLLDKGEIPNAPVSRLEDLFEDPHLVWRQLFKKYPHPSEGEIMMVEPPMRMSRTPPSIRTMAPLQGADSRAVLAEAGMSAAEIEALKQSGALIEPG